MCIAAVVYHEARGEPLQGQVAVAHVVMNRVGRNPARVCAEVRRPRQFHWRPHPRELKAWALALKVARMIDRLPDITYGATHFDAGGAWWAKKMEVTRRIGRHTFYRPKK